VKPGPIKPKISDIVREVISIEEDRKEEVEKIKFSTDFFQNFFVKHGKAYFFVFKKNFKITNMQVIELFSLIRSHIKNLDESDVKNLLFFSSSELENSIEQIYSSFQDITDVDERIDAISLNLHSVLKNSITIRIFHGSCAVYVPEHFKVDLRSVCSLAGYIHSCGINIYSRNVDKADSNYFFKNLKEYINGTNSSKKRRFNVYSHEDFSKNDRIYEPDLRDGLEDVKIYIEKYYMGNENLSSVIRKMQSEFKDHLIIRNSGSSEEDFISAKNDSNNVDTEKSIWLIVDSSINKISGEKENNKYYICYEQIYINQNPFHVFRENKPGWIAHTTIPHDLAGAMLNITMPFWPKKPLIKICDPFGGSGTMFFEGLKYSNVEFYSSDLNPLTPTVVSDNGTILRLAALEIQSIIDKLNILPDVIKNGQMHPDRQGDRGEISDAFHTQIPEILKKKMNIDTFIGGEIEFSVKEVAKIKKLSPFSRIIFYLYLKTLIRHSIQWLVRDSETFNEAFQIESNHFSTLMQNFLRLKKLESIPDSEQGKFHLTEGEYSNSCSIEGQHIWDESYSRFISVKSVINLEKNLFDVIVCDPPYGFNVGKEATSLSRLYVDMIYSLISALSDDGQLVISLPEKSFNGRKIPGFIDKKLITQQILTAASELNKEVINEAFTYPGPNKIFAPPFYWESDRALRRSILHFRIRSRSTVQL
jgi:16S rRNA G966 N2-methylase RsmD